MCETLNLPTMTRITGCCDIHHRATVGKRRRLGVKTLIQAQEMRRMAYNGIQVVENAQPNEGLVAAHLAICLPCSSVAFCKLEHLCVALEEIK